LVYEIAADGDADHRCLSAWRLTDPREDKDRILSSKDSLLEGSCSWILHDRAFTHWWNNDESCILWIHGDPGKGKTMITMALIDEMSRRLQSNPGSGILSYFFCQNTIKELSNAGSIVRGLIYLLATQNPALISHLRKKYDEAGSRLFDGVNTLHAFWATLSEMLQDPSLPKVYLMVDALDECEPQSLRTFLILLTQHTSSLSCKVKWVLTSRNQPSISEYLQCARQCARPIYEMSLESKSSYVLEAVKSFIDFKVSELAARKKYKSELQRWVREYFISHADETFLWVALVCKELEKVLAWRTRDVCRRFPAGLKHLYQRMMEQIQHDRDVEEVKVCVQILCTVTLACRPLHLNELGIIAGLPEDLHNDSQALQDLVGSCGSFLTLRKQTTYFVHQSAKDYFSTGSGSNIFSAKQSDAHGLLFNRSLRLMSESLRRDVCSLRRPGASMREIENDMVSRHIPAHVQYACCYWVHHLKESGDALKERNQVHTFLEKHLLHWLEALSLIRKTSEGVLAINFLEGLITVGSRLKILRKMPANI
jgi:NACHT domain